MARGQRQLGPCFDVWLLGCDAVTVGLIQSRRTTRASLCGRRSYGARPSLKWASLRSVCSYRGSAPNPKAGAPAPRPRVRPAKEVRCGKRAFAALGVFMGFMQSTATTSGPGRGSCPVYARWSRPKHESRVRMLTSPGVASSSSRSKMDPPLVSAVVWRIHCVRTVVG